MNDLESEVRFLASLVPKACEVGYGALGVHGELGYEARRVRFDGREPSNVISAHGPSRIVFGLNGLYRRFDARAGFDQGVMARDTYAHFLVRADGHEVACAPFLYPADGARDVSADITGANELELIILTDRWEYCHSLWLDARVSSELPSAPPLERDDPLHRANIRLPIPKPTAHRCIATVVSPGFEEQLHDLLWSLRTFGTCDDAIVVIFAVNASDRCRTLAQAYDALIIECRSRAAIGLAIKSLLYATASVIDARWYLCLDADTLILSSLEPIFAACELAPPGKVLVCREANHTESWRLGSAVGHTYYGKEKDIQRILGGNLNGEANYPLVVNDGVFAGDKQALLAVEAQIRRMPYGVSWMEEASRRCWWRNQFLFNLALARLRNGWELDNLFNVQLHTHDVELVDDVRAFFRGHPARILHFCGGGRSKYVQWRDRMRQRFARL